MYKLKELLTKQIDIKRKPTIYLAEGALDKDARPTAAAWELSEYSNIVLVGDPKIIEKNAMESATYKEYAKVHGMNADELFKKTVERITIINPKSDSAKEKREIYSEAAFKMVGEKWKMSKKDLMEKTTEDMFFSLMATAEIEGYGRDGHAVLGGLYSTTANFFAPGLRLHPRTGTVFEAALFSFPDATFPKDVYPGNIAVFGDVAVITEMTPEKLADIAIGTCKIARDLLPEDIFPKIYASIVSYSTAGSGSGPTVDITRKAYDIICKNLDILKKDDPLYNDIFITPEVQYAVAVNEKQAARKLDPKDPKNIAAGKSNVIILPNLDFGNAMYHMHSAYYQDAQKILCVGGFKNISILDFSRSSKIDGVVLGGLAVVLRQQYLRDFDHTLGK
jgi:phosphotransacetylase